MRADIQAKLAFPEHLDIEITNYCQLSCPMCPRARMTRPLAHMDFSLFTKIIDEARGRVKSCFLHQFGEPTLHPQFPLFVEYAKGAGIFVSTSTNLQSMTPEVAKRIFAIGIDELILSLDSFRKDSYNRIRIGGDFSKTVAGIEMCLSILEDMPNRKTRLVVQAIDMVLNRTDIPLVEETYKLRIEKIGGAVLIKPFEDYIGEVPNFSPAGVPPHWSEPCTMFFYSMTIQADGRVVPCCFDVNGMVELGDAKESSLQAIWDGPAYEGFRRLHEMKIISSIPTCSGCVYGVK
jgi:radical SAM protein with 4Fe4S-binding SPASM domain